MFGTNLLLELIQVAVRAEPLQKDIDFRA